MDRNLNNDPFEWMWNEVRKQYYYSLDEYPILNYSEPTLLSEMENILLYWFDKGVMGFRLGEYNGNSNANYYDVRYVIDFLRIFVDSYSKKKGGFQRILIGQNNYDAKEQFMLQREAIENNYHVIFSDAFMSDFKKDIKSAQNTKYLVDKMLTFSSEDLPPTWIPRGEKELEKKVTGTLTFLTFTLPGSVVIHQGDEIGMTDLIKDNSRENAICKANNKKISQKTPFQWDDSRNSGFSANIQIWLPVSDEYKRANLMRQKSLPRSHYKVYQTLCSLRKSRTLQFGSVSTNIIAGEIMVVQRYLEGSEMFVILSNFGQFVEIGNLTRLGHLPDVLTVILSSEQSMYSPGETVRTDGIKLSKGETVVLIGLEKSCQSSKPVDKIVAKLSDAVQKINTFLNFKDI